VNYYKGRREDLPKLIELKNQFIDDRIEENRYKIKDNNANR
jgi:hypothetical protein